ASTTSPRSGKGSTGRPRGRTRATAAPTRGRTTPSGSTPRRTSRPSRVVAPSWPEQVRDLHEQLAAVVAEPLFRCAGGERKRPPKVARVSDVERRSRVNQIGDQHVGVHAAGRRL